MAKISEYDNYETDKSPSEVAKFQETGVLPVSGKYTDNGNITTKNVKLSELVGGGGGDAESLAGHGLYASNDKLTVDTDDTLKIVEVGYFDDDKRYKVSVTNAVPPTTNASDGDVLTYNDSDGIVWAPAQGGGGGGLPDPSDLVGKNTGSGAGFASFVPYCTVTCDAGNNVTSVGPIKWGYKWHSSSSSPVDGEMT